MSIHGFVPLYIKARSHPLGSPQSYPSTTFQDIAGTRCPYIPLNPHIFYAFLTLTMPAILTNESASTSKPAFSPYKDATRRVRAGAPKRPPFLTLTNQPQSLAQLWPETPSPRLPPPTPKIQTVGLPMYSPTCGTLSDTPHHTHQSPSYFPMVLSPDSTPAGPFQVVRSLHSGAYGSAVAAKDLTTDRRVCLKVIEKSHVAGKGKELNAMRTELTAYKVISTAEPNAHVMDCRGVFQDDSRVFFEMVSPELS